ncbi:hypothetical protein MKW98_027317, partial [Papaver atlanticum]
SSSRFKMLSCDGLIDVPILVQVPALLQQQSTPSKQRRTCRSQTGENDFFDGPSLASTSKLKSATNKGRRKITSHPGAGDLLDVPILTTTSKLKNLFDIPLPTASSELGNLFDVPLRSNYSAPVMPICHNACGIVCSAVNSETNEPGNLFDVPLTSASSIQGNLFEAPLASTSSGIVRLAMNSETNELENLYDVPLTSASSEHGNLFGVPLASTSSGVVCLAVHSETNELENLYDVPLTSASSECGNLFDVPLASASIETVRLAMNSETNKLENLYDVPLTSASSECGNLLDVPLEKTNELENLYDVPLTSASSEHGNLFGVQLASTSSGVVRLAVHSETNELDNLYDMPLTSASSECGNLFDVPLASASIENVRLAMNSETNKLENLYDVPLTSSLSECGNLFDVPLASASTEIVRLAMNSETNELENLYEVPLTNASSERGNLFDVPLASTSSGVVRLAINSETNEFENLYDVPLLISASNGLANLYHLINVQVQSLPVEDTSSIDFSNIVNPDQGAYMQNASPGVGGAYIQDGNFSRPGTIVNHAKRLQGELTKLGLRIKAHEENLRFVKKETDNVDESILDLEVSLAKHRCKNEATTGIHNSTHVQTEEYTVQQILRQVKSAAGVICQLKINHATQVSNLPLTKDVLGIVATLGHVDDDNLSRLFSEFLGLRKMMAIVCMTYEGVKSIETYEMDGKISKASGLHGIGASIGKPVDGRFEVMCLEGLRPYVGDIVSDDPQRKLALTKPRLPNGECPSGFLGFAVNMINLDCSYLSYLTASGIGLRETLFYNLFSRVQVYRTRADMLLALPFICDGALSLDGGIIRSAGMLVLGDRKDVEVRFPLTPPTKKMALNDMDTEDTLKLKKWEKERILEDLQREQQLLALVKQSFESKRQEFTKNVWPKAHPM